MTKKVKKSRVAISKPAERGRGAMFKRTAKYRQDEQVAVRKLMQEAAIQLNEAHNELQDIVTTLRSRLDALEAAN